MKEVSTHPDSFISRLDEGTEGIEVRLWNSVDAQEAANVVASFFMSTFGDPVHEWDEPDQAWEIAHRVMQGKGLPNALESVNLTFSFNGISRVVTHQLVRTRVGAGFGQQGGRDNSWQDFNFRQPISYRLFEGQQRAYIAELMSQLNQMYEEAVSRGISYQDARYMLPMGLETALVGSYNLLSLKGTLQRRLCNRMHWETNHVARLMADLVVSELPWVGLTLRSGCKLTCHSVSPMFPPADIIRTKDGVPGYADDSLILKENMPADGYIWDRSANGCAVIYDSIDRRRIRNEWDNPGVVFSLVDGETPLAALDTNGMWRNV